MCHINMKTIGRNTVALIVIFFSLIFATVLIQANMNDQSSTIYNVSYKNNQVGFIEDKEIMEQVINNIQLRLEYELNTSILIDDIVNILPVYKDDQVLMTEQELEDKLFNVLLYNKDDFFVKANVLSINEDTKVIVKDKETAESVLEDVKSGYLKDDTSAKVENIEFLESVDDASLFVATSSVVEKEEAVEQLKSSKDEKVTYSIKSGDTLYEIALNNDMSLADLLKINPQLQQDSLIHIGQELNLMIPKPVLSVKVQEKLTYQEDIKTPVEYKDDDTQYKSYSKVIQEGEPGIKEITSNVTYVNGLESEREIISEKIIKEPVKKIVAVGTRTLPVFGMPVYGMITSPFGSRWGSFHTGIDIGVRTGTRVKASESGTVIFAGWSGGYGYLVKISHSSGYTTYYAHNSRLYVKKGQKVSRGDVIAASGSTGNSTGPHVHFEIRKNGVPQNPTKYIY
ncbi:metalloendopeptidase [Vallitalea longa]|uniref:Metalloendopeptidase n=1 Tax=Vallitalea longa TaxID=2936439 RepID=A0A9W5Y7Z5_9FIRM|nr:peptidoglycan DD-metalloendopeptidase family protein [Vallitalea longa]GKX27606.1 metalloendopeptidase [Vallitalea longa]